MDPGTTNTVRYFFHQTMKPETDEVMRKYIALAYETAVTNGLHPTKVFIRFAHDTTFNNGRRTKDPISWHVTISFKTEGHEGRKTHIACHGYVKDPKNLDFREATHHGEKPDSTKKKNKNQTACWPDKKEL